MRAEVAVLRWTSRSARRLQALFHPLDDRAEERAAAVHVVGEIMVEMVAHRGLDEARGLEAGEAVLGLALEMRVADEDAEHQLDAVHHVVGGDVLGLLVADQVAERANALGQRGAQARLVGAAVGSRDGVAIIAFAAVAVERPGDRPFGAALAVREVLLADERLVGDGRALADLLGEMVGEAAGELEDGGFGDLGARSSDGSQRQRISTPAKR